MHLCASQTHTTQLLLDFLGTTAREAGSLYVLGDLFESWAGDDVLANDAHAREVAGGFKALSQSGTLVAIMHGNRDFLLGQNFARAAGATLLPDPVETSVSGQRVLLSHGDILCTDDVAYQDFRRQVRSKAWQQSFLAQSLAARRATIAGLRRDSEAEKSTKSDAIMDVNEDAVQALLGEHQFPDLLIHGHTHRPQEHAITVDGHHSTRWVLGDWHQNGDYLRLDASGCTRHLIP